MEIIDYTDKSIVVSGDQTRDVIKELKELGGRFNPNLTHPEKGIKFAGWIFSKKQKELVQTMIDQKNQSIESIIDPIQRLGLQDNGPDPVKKSKAFERSKTVHIAQNVGGQQIAQNVGQQVTKTKDLLFDEIPEVSSENPEIQDLSFSMIVPKVGMRIKVIFGNQQLIMKITQTFQSQDGYTLEFIASVDGRQNYSFVMVGKNWRLLHTEIPHYLNFI
jgi:hypothetical protein